MDYDPGYLDLEQKALQPLDIPFGTRLSSVDRPGLPQWRHGFLAKTAARGGLCDDEGAPLILPDVSSVGPKRPCRRPPATLHGVVFDIFGWEPKRRGVAARILPEAAHDGGASAVA